MDMARLAFTLILASLAAWGIWTDTRERRLPNALALATFTFGLASSASSGGEAIVMALAHFAIALAVCLGLYRIGAFGGGDAKFYAAMAAWFPLGQALDLLTTVAAAGGVLFIVFVVWRRWRRARLASVGASFPSTPDNHASLPYGVAIGLGGLAAFVVS